MKDINFLKENNVDVENSLELFGDMETYNETIKEFKEGIVNKLSQIKKYYQEEDMPNYAILVHSLKSDCKYFGFTKLAELAYNHEINSKENNLKYIKEHFEELMTEASSVQEVVFKYLDDTPETTEISSDTNNTNIILVADDSEVVRVFVNKVFNNQYTIANAKNGDEALEIIKAHEKDDAIKAILLDLNMPKTNGFAVLDYLKEHELLQKMPVTIISGDSSSEAINKAFAYDIVDMITKPFSEDKISSAVYKTINYKNNM